MGVGRDLLIAIIGAAAAAEYRWSCYQIRRCLRWSGQALLLPQLKGMNKKQYELLENPLDDGTPRGELIRVIEASQAPISAIIENYNYLVENCPRKYVLWITATVLTTTLAATGAVYLYHNKPLPTSPPAEYLIMAENSYEPYRVETDLLEDDRINQSVYRYLNTFTSEVERILNLGIPDIKLICQYLLLYLICLLIVIRCKWQLNYICHSTIELTRLSINYQRVK